jgi:hypothetical protein
MYRFESITKAVDCCYKIFFALQAQFPTESAHVWQFLEIEIYEMQPVGKKFSFTAKAINNFGLP